MNRIVQIILHKYNIHFDWLKKIKVMSNTFATSAYIVVCTRYYVKLIRGYWDGLVSHDYNANFFRYTRRNPNRPSEAAVGTRYVFNSLLSSGTYGTYVTCYCHCLTRDRCRCTLEPWRRRVVGYQMNIVRGGVSMSVSGNKTLEILKTRILRRDGVTMIIDGTNDKTLSVSRASQQPNFRHP